ncbi:MAG: hypothetical protein HYT30_00080 [Parcubacteria group bacterium]|nr:hypothetical protein [Parcubacteria group bacterium]
MHAHALRKERIRLTLALHAMQRQWRNLARIAQLRRERTDLLMTLANPLHQAQHHSAWERLDVIVKELDDHARLPQKIVAHERALRKVIHEIKRTFGPQSFRVEHDVEEMQLHAQRWKTRSRTWKDRRMTQYRAS